jgi:hypothetical protein
MRGRTEVIRVHPEEEPDDRPRRVTNALIHAVIRTHAGQRLAVISREKPRQRVRARCNSMRRAVLGEQLDPHAPQRRTKTDNSHRGKGMPDVAPARRYLPADVVLGASLRVQERTRWRTYTTPLSNRRSSSSSSLARSSLGNDGLPRPRTAGPMKR